ncbi:galactose mutarotase-like domain-containing protein, partial [Gorgonomyces haynaldii]
MTVTTNEHSTIIQHGDATAEIYHYGATVTSFKYKNRDVLFCSKKAILNGTKAIRGGIPVVFPQFGPQGPLPQHGFARVSKWHYLGVLTENTHQTTVGFSLEKHQALEQQTKIWPFLFRLEYHVTLSANTLHLKLVVKNLDQSAFDFTVLLHTYLQTQIHEAQVFGLQGLAINDGVSKTRDVDNRSYITVEGEVDRVYEHVGLNALTLKDRQSTVLLKNGFKDVVVWNPWIEKAKALNDFEDEEYKNMICIEVGNVSEKIVLNPGESWTGEQTIVAV